MVKINSQLGYSCEWLAYLHLVSFIMMTDDSWWQQRQIPDSNSFKFSGFKRSPKMNKLENQVHDELYSMLFLLTKMHPPTKDFAAVFKEKMFVKNNKVGFHQVIYYLLNTLNPDLVKEKITAWPLYDVKLETKFRSEVLEILNQLNSIYPDADVPNIMASHLIAPGGFKFVKFMLKLTQLVLFEELKKREDVQRELLNPVKSHKIAAVTSVISKNMCQKTDNIEANIVTLANDFDTFSQKMNQQANIIVSCQERVEHDLKEISQKSKATLNLSESELQETITQRLHDLEEKITSTVKVKDLCIKCDELFTFLTSDEMVLKSDNDFKNLTQFFKTFKLHLENENLELPIFTDLQLKEMVSRIENLNIKYSHLNEQFCINENQLIEAANCDILNNSQTL